MISVTFDRELVTDALLDEALPLLRAHWREIAHFDDIPLQVDREAYLRSEAAGLVRCFTARTTEGILGSGPSQEEAPGAQHAGQGRGRLLGYALFFVRFAPHYAGSLQAVQDVVYLDRSVRGGTGYRFIAWCDEQLAEEGAQAVYHHVKVAHNFGKLLERQGYELVDLIYAKRLDT
jgi:hypothetical protein